MALSSAPAVLRTPAVPMEESLSCACSPDMVQREVYPWVCSTPEPETMWPGLAPSMERSLVQEPAQLLLPADLMQIVCAPLFEDVSLTLPKGHTASFVSAELRRKCEPMFEEMIASLQQAIQTMQIEQDNVDTRMMLPYLGSCYRTTCEESGLSSRFEDHSTDAEDACAFASIFSVSSEGEGLDSVDSMSDMCSPCVAKESYTDTANEAEKSVMVCRHWKSKGWCRLESNCKFLHPEHKRGVTQASGKNSKDSCGECMAPPTKSGGRKKKLSQKRVGNSQLMDIANKQNVLMTQHPLQQGRFAEFMSVAPETWLAAPFCLAR